eukprot:11385615-Ditylum_brightwellii.AAC.1
MDGLGRVGGKNTRTRMASKSKHAGLPTQKKSGSTQQSDMDGANPNMDGAGSESIQPSSSIENLKKSGENKTAKHASSVKNLKGSGEKQNPQPVGSPMKKCPACNGTDHQRSSSRLCQAQKKAAPKSSKQKKR